MYVAAVKAAAVVIDGAAFTTSDEAGELVTEAGLPALSVAVIVNE